MAEVSFWEREQFLSCDVLVIGAGIIGLSAAISLKEAAPQAEVLVLEREVLPSGASTKNAGFAYFGSLTELLRDLETIGEEELCSITRDRKAGIDLLRARLGDSAIGYSPCGSFELLWKKDEQALQSLDKINALLQPIFGPEYLRLQNDAIGAFGFNRDEVRNLIFCRYGGAIDSGRMMKGLWNYAAARGVRIHSGAVVSGIEPRESSVAVRVKRPVLREELAFSASKVIVATNALAPGLSGSSSLSPGRGQVLITDPIPGLKFQGTFHFDECYYYFRSVGNRILFGGGRNLDFKGETSGEFETTDRIQNQLDWYLKNVLIPGVQYRVDMRWAGIMGFNPPHRPEIRLAGPRIVQAFGCNGMGVALGTSSGKRAAELVLRD